MGVSVTFDYAAWCVAFPELAYIAQPQATAYFDFATGICPNDGGGFAPTTALQSLYLNLLTAHVAKLFAPNADGSPASGLVGRINSASEGSVSVGVELAGATFNAAWFAQTQYGLTYWQMTAGYRTMRYRPAPQYLFPGCFGGL